MQTYTIDVWQEQNIWTWDGPASSEEDAREAARVQLNDDWSADYPTWDDLAADMHGTALVEHPAVMAERLPLDTITLYRRLADGLSDMIEGDRLTESAIPDDYRWLAAQLAAIAAADPGDTELPAHMRADGDA